MGKALSRNLYNVAKLPIHHNMSQHLLNSRGFVIKQRESVPSIAAALNESGPKRACWM